MFPKKIKTISVLTSSGNDEWETPHYLFNHYNKLYQFTLDPCCTKETAKCPVYYTKEDNGLNKSWKNEKVFMNPPYSRGLMKQFIRKAYIESEENNALVLALIPSRTDTKYFHTYISKAKEIIFLKGRLKFLLYGKPHQSAPFPSMIVIWNKQPLKKTENLCLLS